MASFTKNEPDSEEHGQSKDDVKAIPTLFNLANGFVEFIRIKGDMSEEGKKEEEVAEED